MSYPMTDPRLWPTMTTRSNSPELWSLRSSVTPSLRMALRASTFAGRGVRYRAASASDVRTEREQEVDDDEPDGGVRLPAGPQRTQLAAEQRARQEPQGQAGEHDSEDLQGADDRAQPPVE